MDAPSVPTTSGSSATKPDATVLPARPPQCNENVGVKRLYTRGGSGGASSAGIDHGQRFGSADGSFTFRAPVAALKQQQESERGGGGFSAVFAHVHSAVAWSQQAGAPQK